MAPPAAAAPRVRRIDGPQLPHLHHYSPASSHQDFSSLAPLIAPPSSDGSDGNADGEEGRYLLVPSPKRIVVRSARHGGRVGELLPQGNDVEIRAVCVVRLPRRQESDVNDDEDENESEEGSDNGEEEGGEWVILAGCRDGLVHEWPVAGLSQASKSAESVPPRRSWRLACDALLHLATVAHDDNAGSTMFAKGASLYGLVEGTEGAWLVRCALPPFAPPSEGEAPLPLQRLVAMKNVPSKSYGEEASRNRHVCLRSNDAVFGLAASYRPSAKAGGSRMEYATGDDDDDASSTGGVLVVLASAHGLAVYRDSLATVADDVADPSKALVHLSKLLKPPPLYAKDQTAFCSLAVSPGTTDLALGRASGHIEILDNLFANVISYLDGLARKEEGLQHPEETTVRRTVHWHAHPVRALAFQSARPATLLSGGEESVLATWQLERNSHRPSDFVARVAAGGIVHLLCDRSAGRVVVFCSDNSIQCFNATNREREWAAQGLASMSLHAEDDKQMNGGRGPIVAVQDPITGHPLLANLPGAPGTVHWYDPAAAAVVGTLEVAPYNRVSRRDPTVDPHVPAPAVTHLAIGRDGKDMVTVDRVWTENTSVGAECNLAAPKGTVSMNVCTSIKFWRHEASKGKPDHRKRRAGDMPMNYVLASSMAAPHGRDGAVRALAVAPSGDIACTLSREEGAFRVWAKHATAPSGGAGATPWRCRYKVKTPAGYANLLSPRVAPSSDQQLVSFSSDGSVLAVTYGPYVTLWDHSSAALLTSLTLDGSSSTDGASEDVQTVNFLTQNDDVMLLTTARQMNVKSPCGGFKSRYLGNDEWAFDAGCLGNDARISAVVPLYEFRFASAGSKGCFAVAFAMDGGSRSEVVVIRRDEGSVLCVEGTGTPLRWSIDGEVQSLCVASCVGPVVKLLAITMDCEMLSLSSGVDKKVKKGAASSAGIQSTRDARAQAPVLKLGSETADAEPTVKRRKVSIIGSVGSDRAKGVAGFEFPQLSGKFTTAFIAKSLKR